MVYEEPHTARSPHHRVTADTGQAREHRCAWASFQWPPSRSANPALGQSTRASCATDGGSELQTAVRAESISPNTVAMSIAVLKILGITPLAPSLSSNMVAALCAGCPGGKIRSTGLCSPVSKAMPCSINALIAPAQIVPAPAPGQTGQRPARYSGSSMLRLSNVRGISQARAGLINLRQVALAHPTRSVRGQVEALGHVLPYGGRARELLACSPGFLVSALPRRMQDMCRALRKLTATERVEGQRPLRNLSARNVPGKFSTFDNRNIGRPRILADDWPVLAWRGERDDDLRRVYERMIEQGIALDTGEPEPVDRILPPGASRAKRWTCC